MGFLDKFKQSAGEKLQEGLMENLEAFKKSGDSEYGKNLLTISHGALVLEDPATTQCVDAAMGSFATEVKRRAAMENLTPIAYARKQGFEAIAEVLEEASLKEKKPEIVIPEANKMSGSGFDNQKFHIGGDIRGAVIGDNVTVNFEFGATTGAKPTPVPQASASEKMGKVLCAWIETGDEQEAIKEINKGAFVEAKNRHGDTALILAARAGMPNVVSMLIEKGASINETGDGGMTALHASSISGATASAKMLLAANADTSIKDEDGKLASDYARMMHRDDISAMISGQPTSAAGEKNTMQTPSSKPPQP